MTFGQKSQLSEFYSSHFTAPFWLDQIGIQNPAAGEQNWHPRTQRVGRFGTCAKCKIVHRAYRSELGQSSGLFK
ncbi:hypothetical protein [Ruegeria lacuscaerulensis]|uniref:hypothetical protein n=1 Tax=Ruegeria lacuscaerulensis TaxID=55218 RepID=UPI001BE46687|nr:hypothetical protein [Ruegeria lacuscaerulensis]